MDHLRKSVPVAALLMLAGSSFAGAPQWTAPEGRGVAGQGAVYQAEPTPEFCKKNPTDPRCDKK